MELHECCSTLSLKTVKRFYESNSDIFEVMQCAHCQKYWLYRHREPDWWDNCMLQFSEYEAWYIPLQEEELPKVYAMDFSGIGYRDGYTHVNTEVPVSDSPIWNRIKTPLMPSRLKKGE